VGLGRRSGPAGFVMLGSLPVVSSVVLPGVPSSSFLPLPVGPALLKPLRQKVEGSGGAVALAFRPAVADLRAGATCKLTRDHESRSWKLKTERRPRVSPLGRSPGVGGSPLLADLKIQRTNRECL